MRDRALFKNLCGTTEVTTFFKSDVVLKGVARRISTIRRATAFAKGSSPYLRNMSSSSSGLYVFKISSADSPFLPKRISILASCLKLNPRSASSSCLEDKPKSSKSPSMPSLMLHALSNESLIKTTSGISVPFNIPPRIPARLCSMASSSLS